MVTTATAATAATVMAFLLTLAAPISIFLLPLSLQQADAFVNRDIDDAPIAASGDNVYVVWASNQSEIMFRASNDGGQTFSDKINLSNSTEFSSLHPYVAASGDNNVYVSFHDNRTGNVDTYVRVSTDGGQTFSDNIIRINGTGTMPQQTKLVTIPGVDPLLDSEENTRIAASGDNVYVVSWDRKSGNWEVFIARSTDNGQTFEETINLSNTSDTRSDQAEIVAEGENVYVSWWEKSENGTREPVMRVSNDDGETFEPVLRLSANGTIGSEGGEGGGEGGEGAEVTGATAEIRQEGEVRLVAEVGREQRATNQVGHDFNILISTIGSEESLLLQSEASHIAKSGDNMYITWWGDDEALFAKSTDNGATFGDIINLSNSPFAIDYDSRVIASGKNVYVTWSEDNLIPSKSDAIWFRASSDYGSTFGPPIRINSDAPLHLHGVSGGPTSDFGIVKPTDDHFTRIVASGDNVYVVWYCHEIKDNWEVYFRASNDSGKTFGETINLSNSPDRVSHLPEITTDTHGNVYVTYWDDRLGEDKKQFTTISTDEGRTFSSAIQVKDLSNNNSGSDVAVISAVSANRN